MALQFHRVQATNWRNFSNIDVTLQNRAFLVGANASGKSNFLDIFRFLADIAAASGGGLQQAVKNRRGIAAIRHNQTHRAAAVVIDVTLNEHGSEAWRYCLEFAEDTTGTVLKREVVWRDGTKILERPDTDDNTDKARLQQTYLEQTSNNADFRAIATFFQSIQYANIVPQFIRDREYLLSIDERFTTSGSHFIKQMADIDEDSRTERLDRIQHVLQIAIPQLTKIGWATEYGHPYLWGFWSTGQEIRDSAFSDGTLRLIGLLWALQDGTGALLLEEPERSLQAGIVRYLPQMMRNIQPDREHLRQMIVTTHSAELLSDIGIGASEVLLFQVTSDGTQILVGADDNEIMIELQAGFTMAEIMMPRTEPRNLNELLQASS